MRRLANGWHDRLFALLIPAEWDLLMFKTGVAGQLSSVLKSEHAADLLDPPPARRSQ